MMHSSVLAAVLCLILALGAVLAPRALGDESKMELGRLKIGFARDSEGRVTSVELPPQARDEHIEAIVRISSIEEVKAPDCRATPDSLASLKQLPRLNALYLERAAQANDYVVAIKDFRTLTTLSLARSQLTNHGLDDLCTFHPQLRELDISHSHATWRFAVPAVSKLHELEVLDISALQPEFGDDRARPDFGELADLRRLRRLRSRGGEAIHGDELMAFGRTCFLEQIIVDWNRVRGRFAALHLQKCHPQLGLGGVIATALGVPNSTNLEGHLQQIKPICFHERFAQLPPELLSHVRDVDIVAAPNLDFLSAMPELERLRLHGLRMDRKELARLRSVHSLKSLTVSGATIDREIADMLLAAPALKYLTLERCKFEGNVAMKIQPETGEIEVRIEP